MDAPLRVEKSNAIWGSTGIPVSRVETPGWLATCELLEEEKMLLLLAAAAAPRDIHPMAGNVGKLSSTAPTSSASHTRVNLASLKAKSGPANLDYQAWLRFQRSRKCICFPKLSSYSAALQAFATRSRKNKRHHLCLMSSKVGKIGLCLS